MLRFVVFAALASLVLSAFGVQVCPYLHSFGPGGIVAVLAASFVVVAVARVFLQRRVDAAPLLEQPGRQLALDTGLFVVAGVLAMVFDEVFFGFPISSGGRLVVGALTLGLFAGLDSALLRERVVLSRRRDEGSVDADVSGGFFSLSRKFALVAFALFTLLTADLLLLALQDLRGIIEIGAPPSHMPPYPPSSVKELVTESLVALLVLLPLLGNLIWSFSLNLGLFLNNQREALEAVARGRLDVNVAVASNDEFAVIASRTNQMIAGLRDRKRVQELVGKLVSPAIAERLLASTDGFKLQGSRRKVVVLFSDVRNFTTRTEKAEPEQLVQDLNRYFTEMVDVVHAHGGLVDKFIGDGMMAVFGLEDVDGAADAAVLAAREMHVRLEALNAKLSEPMAIGVGIHAGEVIAGTIGSPERLEFTFIGDAVNAAARIEGLTKEVGASPLISLAVKSALRAAPKDWAWVDVGDHALKGKSEHLALFRVA